MRRFLTLVCLLGLAIPAGVSISGCTVTLPGSTVRRPRATACCRARWRHHASTGDCGHLAGLRADHSGADASSV